MPIAAILYSTHAGDCAGALCAAALVPWGGKANGTIKNPAPCVLGSDLWAVLSVEGISTDGFSAISLIQASLSRSLWKLSRGRSQTWGTEARHTVCLVTYPCTTILTGRDARTVSTFFAYRARDCLYVSVCVVIIACVVVFWVGGLYRSPVLGFDTM